MPAAILKFNDIFFHQKFDSFFRLARISRSMVIMKGSCRLLRIQFIIPATAKLLSSVPFYTFSPKRHSILPTKLVLPNKPYSIFIRLGREIWDRHSSTATTTENTFLMVFIRMNIRRHLLWLVQSHACTLLYLCRLHNFCYIISDSLQSGSSRLTRL